MSRDGTLCRYVQVDNVVKKHFELTTFIKWSPGTSEESCCGVSVALVIQLCHEGMKELFFLFA